MTYNFCPDCGSECEKINFKTYECRACNKRWYNEPFCAAAAIIINSHDEILFITRASDPGKGTLSIPGGFVDNGESLEQGVIREAKEEAGVTVYDLKYICSHPIVYKQDKGQTTVVTTFFCGKTQDRGFVGDKDEVTDVHWIKPQDVDLNKIGLEDVKQTIRNYLATIDQ